VKVELPDNAREAFQFAALAVGIVAALRLGYHGIDHLLLPAADDALGQALVPYRAGYLVSDRTLVVDAPPLLERLGVAVLLSMGLAVVASIAGAFLARPFGQDTTRWAVRSARAALVLALPFTLFSALAVPARCVRSGERGLDLIDRPWSGATIIARSDLWRWEQIAGFEVVDTWPEGESGGLMLITTNGTRVPLWHHPFASADDLQHLATLLEQERQVRRSKQGR
jgi:hypothetical protein